MENYPYAVFAFKRRVKSFKGLLSGELIEEKDFFKTLSIKEVKTLKELVEHSPLIKHALKAFSLTKSPTRILFNLEGKKFYLSVEEKDIKPYSIVLKIIEEDAIGYFKQMSETVPVALALLDKNSNIIDVNTKFEELFGYKREEIIGKDLNELIVPKEEISDGRKLDEIAGTTGYVRVERKRLRKNGKEIPVLVSGSPFEVDGKTIGIIGVYEDISEIKKIQEVLYYQATHDTMTGLPNRYLLSDRFNLEKAKADRENAKVALFFIDINEFKHINDTYGHDFGDKVIKSVADRLISSVRKTDSVVRFGGDEFVIVFNSVKTLDDIVSIAIKVINAFYEKLEIDGVKLDVPINVGIAVYPDDGETLEELLRKGDLAMYEAKAIGTNNFVFYTKDIEIEHIKEISSQKIRELLFKLIFDKSPLPEVILNKDLRILSINEKFKEVFNLNLRKVYAKSIVEVINEPQIEDALKNFKKEINPFIIKLGGENFKCFVSKVKAFGIEYYLLTLVEVNNGSK